MFSLFEGITADEVWRKAASAFKDVGQMVQPSRAGPTVEILNCALSISDPTQRWVSSRWPPINPAFALAEVIWLMAGRNDSHVLNYFNRQLPKYAGYGPVYHGAYGHRLRRHLGFDQVEQAYQALKTRPDSRQIVLQLWDGRVDFPSSSGKEASPDIPCNVVSMLNVRAGKLEWTQVLRSNDLFRGLPYNFIQFTTLQEVMAGWLGLDIGRYHQISNSLHVYSADLDKVQAPLEIIVANNSDLLTSPKDESEKAFHELERRVEEIVDDGLGVGRLLTSALRTDLPPAFLNMLCVLCAEGARRRGSAEVAREIMRHCTNTGYRLLFERWLDSRLEPSKLNVRNQNC
jgi:thymidylate synthase